MKVLRRIVLVCSFSLTMFAQRESLLIGPGNLAHVQVFDTPDLDETARVNDAGELPL